MLTEKKNETQSVEGKISMGQNLLDKLGNLGTFDVCSDVLSIHRESMEFIDKFGNHYDGFTDKWKEVLIDFAWPDYPFGDNENRRDEVRKKLESIECDRLLKNFFSPVYELALADHNGTLKSSFKIPDSDFFADDLMELNDFVNDIVIPMYNSEISVDFHGWDKHMPLLNKTALLVNNLRTTSSLKEKIMNINFKSNINKLNTNLELMIMNNDFEINNESNPDDEVFELIRNNLVEIIVLLKNQKREFDAYKKLWSEIADDFGNRIDLDDMYETREELIKPIMHDELIDENKGYIPAASNAPRNFGKKLSSLLDKIGNFIDNRHSFLKELIDAMKEYADVIIPKSINITHRINRRLDSTIESIDKLIAIKKNKYHYKANNDQLLEIHSKVSAKFAEFETYFLEKVRENYNNVDNKSISITNPDELNASKKVVFATYEDLRKYIREDMSITCFREYTEHAKDKNNNVPQRPDIKFTGKGWIDWDTFFGVAKKISNKEKGECCIAYLKENNTSKIPQSAIFLDHSGNKINIGTFRAMLQQKAATHEISPELQNILAKISDEENEQRNKEVAI